MDQIYLVVVAVVALFNFFVLFMAFKRWNIWQVLAVGFLFFGAVAYSAFSAASLKTHSEWKLAYKNLTEKLAEKKAQEQILLEGGADAAGNTVPSLYELRSDIGKVLTDRGRVWQECTPRNVQRNGVEIIVFPASRDPEKMAEYDSRIRKGMILYAFSESLPMPGPIPGGAPSVDVPGGPTGSDPTAAAPTRLPSVFLGRFQVVNPPAAPNHLATLVPLLSANDPVQMQALNQPATWSLYEVMPIDNHHIFAADDKVHLQDGKLFLFGKMLTPEEIKAYIPNRFNLPEAEYEKLINSFAHDGQRADESVPNSDTWVKVKFTKEHKIKVDSENPATPLTEENFDPQGRALRRRLMQGGEGEIVFNEGDWGVFPRSRTGLDDTFDIGSADELLADGVAERDEAEPRIYVRPLHDYDHEYDQVFKEYVRLNNKIKKVNAQIAEIADATAKTQTQIDARQDEFTKLQHDLKNFQQEANEITAYAEKLDKQLTSTRGQQSALYNQNIRLAQELAALQQRATQHLDRRTSRLAR